MPKDSRSEQLSMELSGSTASIMLTQGAINVWFGRNSDKNLVSDILLIISKIDSSTYHVQEILCEFNQISEFECDGYILTSYAKKQDKYRAIFVVPFSDTRALERFIESITEKTDQSEVRITLYWNGSRIGMNILRDELGRLNCFSEIKIIPKEEQAGSL